MKKLKLKDLSAIGNVLTSEELKHVYGGSGSGSTIGGRCTCRLYHRIMEGHTYTPPVINTNNATACRSVCDNYLSNNVLYNKYYYIFKDSRCSGSHYGNCLCESGWGYE